MALWYGILDMYNCKSYAKMRFNTQKRGNYEKSFFTSHDP